MYGFGVDSWDVVVVVVSDFLYLGSCVGAVKGMTFPRDLPLQYPTWRRKRLSGTDMDRFPRSHTLKRAMFYEAIAFLAEKYTLSIEVGSHTIIPGLIPSRMVKLRLQDAFQCQCPSRSPMLQELFKRTLQASNTPSNAFGPRKDRQEYHIQQEPRH